MTDFFVGGAERRPCVLPLCFLRARRGEPRLAPAQTEVRAKDFFGRNLFSKKVALPRDFRQILCLFYPFRHRFEPASPLLFNACHLLFQRLLFGKEFGFFGAVDFALNILFQIAIEKSLELGLNGADFGFGFLNKSGCGLGGFSFLFSKHSGQFRRPILSQRKFLKECGNLVV
ncbi:MAG: hypothetical protein PHQ08_00755 [Candidatus Pacebacteria bacterium]|nr:hypothetical protein [Candidatus Paceibacterota bacterium]